MGKIITVAIEKGGVGKTTTVINLAALYGMNNKKTLVIDMDPQANCTKGLTNGKSKSEFNGHGVFDMLRSFGLSKTKDFITNSSLENVDIIPSNEYSNQILNMLPIIKAQYGKPEYVYLAACIGEIIDDYDIILIDTPPSKDTLASSALFCADEVIIPFYADGYSADGMNSTYALIHKLCQESNVSINVLGILMTKVERTTANSYLREVIKNSTFGEDLFVTEIRKSVAVSDSTILSIPVVISDPKSNPAIDYVNLYNEINNKLYHNKEL